MGHALLLCRLIVRDLRRRPGEAAVFVLAVALAATSLALGTAAGDAVTTGYLTTRAATAGPDIVAVTTAADPAAVAAAIAKAPGVAAQADPVFAFDTTVRARGQDAHSAVEAAGPATTPVDRPLVTAGTWVRPGGAVLERGFAQALGLAVGDQVVIRGRGYPVVGTAISAATAVYPWSDDAQGPGPSDFGGRIWLTAADTRAAAGDAPGVHLIRLKLTDPGATKQWQDTAFPRGERGTAWVTTHNWQGVLMTDQAMIENTRPALVVGGWLLTVAAVVTLAALATVRTARDNRRAALLKAVGAGPGTVIAVLLAQYLVLTALAAGGGLAAGAWLAPRLVDPSAGLLDSVTRPGAGTVGVALVLAAVVAAAGAVGPAVRAARTSTAGALADRSADLLTHHPHLNAVTSHLPTPLLLGVRLLARRPGRAALAAAGTAAGTVMVTALLTWHADLGSRPDFRQFGPIQVRADQTGRVLLAVTLALVALSALNAVLLGWSTAVQARHTLTVARTLGATPGQVVCALCVAQFLPALPGVAAGVPTGLLLYWFFGDTVTPPASWLLTAALAVLLTVAALTALPAWAHTRVPAGRALGAETG
ncbi:FtsX-like permease family protein [Actinacidiphila bryophytorum]|uniref:FtsX domain-containing protein n=1 Tax=Actinacidiphila bryophytorum TaxID=1436133 RepID=A0A9W4H484_9ACTN|nr:FtsX-like permease family protein [Actinacidiphila bryophytorum]MBM9435921.1 ABC transporter permease [Actinacidiphila bryophytorum]MBN6541516.1 ABC transporter permease [Actinacidiphila bryophytorum]CAG7649548.1 FtsX domain-containing protein [Actinacidiphila bryophytorum]